MSARRPLVRALTSCDDVSSQFFAQNPLSQLGIMACRGGVAERVTELSGAPEAHIAALKRALRCDGDLSLQNMLEQATASLARIPPYGSRELCVLQSALTTCDPVRARVRLLACRLVLISSHRPFPLLAVSRETCTQPSLRRRRRACESASSASRLKCTSRDGRARPRAPQLSASQRELLFKSLHDSCGRPRRRRAAATASAWTRSTWSSC